MTETRFTPGPWAHEDGTIYGTDFGYTVPLFDVSDYEENERFHDDMNLIAAAPELYEATEPFDELFTHHAADAPEWKDRDRVVVQLTIGDLRAIKAARAKARGES